MIHGVGVDILRNERIRNGFDEDSPFVRMTFTKAERTEASERHSPQDYYCGRFAAKEAVYKAISPNDDSLGVADIEIVAGAHGKPEVSFSKAMTVYLQACGIVNVQVSISEEDEYTLAFAVAEKRSMEDLT
jgi:holo-[acyl-carrier protein] synthase